MNRRTFIGTSIAASVAAVAHPGWGANSGHKIERIGLQLYTVRAAMKSDFEGTITKVAATGYKDVEFAGYFDRSPKDIRALLDKNGLSSPSCHVGYDVVEKKWAETIEAAKIVGHSCIVCPSIEAKHRVEPGGWKRAVDLFNKAGEISQKLASNSAITTIRSNLNRQRLSAASCLTISSSKNWIPSLSLWKWTCAGSAWPERIR